MRRQKEKRKRGAWKRNLLSFIINDKAVILLVGLVLLSQFLTNGLFLSYENVTAVLRQVSVPAILGLGFTVVLASGGFDLSIANMLGLLGCVYASLTLKMPILPAILFTLLISVLCGLCNGFLIEAFSLSPFLITLATAQMFKGLAGLVVNGQVVGGLSQQVKYFGRGTVFGFLPLSVLFAVAIAVILAFVFRFTLYGRFTLATGGNRASARTSGIRVKLISVSSYIVMGICVAIGAVLLVGRLSSAYTNMGGGAEMEAIAAVFIGGTRIKGGKANFMGTMFGCLSIGVMNNLFGFLEIGSFWQSVVKSLVIILVMILETKSENYLEKSYEIE